MKNKEFFFIIVLFLLTFKDLALAKNLYWRAIPLGGLTNIRDVFSPSKDPTSIYIATQEGIFRIDGESKKEFLLKTKEANFLYQDISGIIYVGSLDGLYSIEPKTYRIKRIFKTKNSFKEKVNSLIFTQENHIYLGTSNGLFISKDQTKSWKKILPFKVIKLAYDALDKLIFILTEEGLYKLDIKSQFYERVFFSKKSIFEEEFKEEDLEEEKSIYNDIKLDEAKNLYLATERGLYFSKDKAKTWIYFNHSGLLNISIKLIYIKSSSIYVVTSRGLFLYLKDKDLWQELTLKLPLLNIQAIFEDEKGCLYLATDKGLFLSDTERDFLDTKDIQKIFHQEPDILELQKQVLYYAGIVQNQTIKRHQILARLKAILPKLDLDINKTVTYYNNSNSTRFAIGPKDWKITLSWNLSDLIWSEQLRLIDSQTRLLIELRNELLDELNRIYFERLRIKQELLSKELDPQKYSEKILKLKELEASLDALTGGYFSQKIKE
ncbi:MAG: hypothetical protein NC903_01600 [Candidatus Omnitrophica bacterium]|nr:hypothetical protein [Candidatus Omnitrophota bacterium]